MESMRWRRRRCGQLFSWGRREKRRPAMTNAAAILDFYKKLRPRFALPAGISIMNPYQEPATWTVVKQFYTKFYGDEAPRSYIFGINPGRHGAGVTGIPFTDPIRL